MSASRGCLASWRTAGASVALLAVAGIALAQAPPRRPPQAATPAQRAADAGCDRCHNELELLRQQSGGLARARELFVPAHVVDSSAHADLTCSSCHSGVARYPHTVTPASTRSCASCHEAADTLWQGGVHASADEPVQCVQCHSVHAVQPAGDTPTGTHVRPLNQLCTACHEASLLPAHSPHADTVACASCHGAHGTRGIDDPLAGIAPANQVKTCGTCHDSTATIWASRDIHGNAGLREAHLGGREAVAASVSCTSCHTGHSMNATDAAGFALESVERCAECHEKASRTFYGSYHGKATALGSLVSAACYSCHSAHEVLPDSMPASHVSDARVVDTCRQCHENANAGFVKYDSHPDPFNRDRNPWLFYAFFGMNFLLVNVLLVFGGHTVMWWIRLWLDRRRRIVHGPGHGHGGEE